MRDNWEDGGHNFRRLRSGGSDDENGGNGYSSSSSSDNNNNNNNNNKKDDDDDDKDKWWWQRRGSPSTRWLRQSSDLFDSSLFDWNWFGDRFPFSFVGGLFDRRPDYDLFAGDLEASGPFPIIYLMLSPYSPLYLERQQNDRLDSFDSLGAFSSITSSLSQSSSDEQPTEPHWREAFEDLLRVTNGKPMLDRTNNNNTRKESAREWLKGLASRGSLGGNWQFDDDSPGIAFHKISGDDRQRRQRQNGLAPLTDNKLEKDAKEETAQKEETGLSTEADLYDAFLQDIENRHREVFTESPLINFLLDMKRRHGEQLPPPTAAVGEQDDKMQYRIDETAQSSSIVDGPSDKPQSTMTSTERSRLADGSVRTKIITTERFADGREETKQSEELTNPPRVTESPPSPTVHNATEKKESSKGGWFWK